MTPTAVRKRAGPKRATRRPRRAAADRSSGERLRDVSLDDRYLLERGRVLITGIQALVRLPFDQRRADRRRGLETGTMISGYQGSPLGGFDKELARNKALCREHHVFHVPGLNEELGATSGWGSQLAAQLSGARYDGALAMWYGKAPGLDRAADALRHGNYVGVSRTGGALAVVGDDPSCKSSTLPSASETMLASFGMPVFFPGSVQEVLDLGLHAFACSRASGLWCGFKIVTEVADSVGTAEVAPDRVMPKLPDLNYEHRPDATLLPPSSLEMERSLFGERTDLALAYARENSVNRVEGDDDAWLGVVAAGKPYHDLLQALRDLGLGERELKRAGIRVLRLGMIWPLEPRIVRDFAAGLDELLVIEEKRPFVETQLKELLYGDAAAPRIVGKRDERGTPLLPAELDLGADKVARALGARLAARGVRIESVESRLRKLTQAESGPAALPMAPPAARSPFFCSGCPHNTSLKSPDGTLVGAGIGCHTMALLNPEGKGEITGVTQMGGEGAQWIGMAPFTSDRHFVQNLGDGTFSHSGSLAVRAAVAAGVNVTFKLLYNEAVAMTGGQKVEGGLPVPELTRLLELEGVKRIVVTAEDPSRYRGVELSPVADLRDRSELLDAQEELSRVEGVTVLIHDQQCAAERRRLRKRGKAAEPAERVWINERVCEGCGDCGRKSSCLSVMPVETEFGRKSQIHQASCNKDYSCVEGDCPSFLTVVPGEKSTRKAPPLPIELPEPRRRTGGEAVIRMMGIGGTGVVTVNQIVGMAALMDGAHVSGLDQTGLSQKGGPVTSDLRISGEPMEGSNKASAADVDLYLGFDLLGAVNPKNLAACDPERTVAVVSTSVVPTGRMVVDAEHRFPELRAQLDLVDGVTRTELNLCFDAQELSQRLFADHMPANMIALGAAWQRGLIPVSLEALDRAIELNGVAVERNRTALAWGRAVAAAPEAVEDATRERGDVEAAPDPTERERELIDGVTVEDGALRTLLERRVPELAAYQDLAYAERYADKIARVKAAEEERAPGHTELTEAVAGYLFKLMAYKDEYEVARLHLAAAEHAKLRREFGDDAKIWFNLQPPLLRGLGLGRKLKLGSWFVPGFRVLHAMRWLRGTRLDPFGWTKVRRVERELVGEYEDLVLEALRALSPETHQLAVELCELPDVIRGYEEIKLRNVELFRKQAEALRRRLGRPAAAPTSS